MKRSNIWLPLIRQESGDCASTDVRADRDKIVGTIDVSGAPNGPFRVDVAIKKGMPDAIYDFYLKCKRPLFDFRTDHQGVGSGWGEFEKEEVGDEPFAFDCYQGRPRPGDRFNSLTVNREDGMFISSERDPVDFFASTFPDVHNYLIGKGWVVKAGDGSALVDVDSVNGAVHCVDGRLPKSVDGPVPGNDQAAALQGLMRGPKVQGGALGIAALMLRNGRQWGMQKAVQMIKQADYIASVHGDEHDGRRGCGFARFWEEAALETLGRWPAAGSRLEIGREAAVSEVQKAGGKFITLQGEHHETFVRLNFVADKTFVPDEKAYNLDVWFPVRLGQEADYINGIDPEALMSNAVDTVFTIWKNSREQPRPPIPDIHVVY